MDEYGRIHFPSTTNNNIWMSTSELIDLFGIKIKPESKKLYYNNLYTDYFDYICQIMTNCIVMMFAQRIKTAREEKGLLQKELATALNIDVPMYSRIERGKRQAKRNQVETIACILNTDKNELIDLWLADKVYSVIANETNPDNILNIVRKSL